MLKVQVLEVERVLPAVDTDGDEAEQGILVRHGRDHKTLSSLGVVFEPAPAAGLDAEGACARFFQKMEWLKCPPPLNFRAARKGDALLGRESLGVRNPGGVEGAGGGLMVLDVVQCHDQPGAVGFGVLTEGREPSLQCYFISSEGGEKGWDGRARMVVASSQ